MAHKTIEDYQKTIKTAQRKMNALKKKEAERKLKEDAAFGNLLYDAFSKHFLQRGYDRDQLMTLTPEEIRNVFKIKLDEQKPPAGAQWK